MNTPNYDAFASTFSKSRSHMRWPEIDILVTDMFRRFDASGIKTPPRILDVGCGNGRLLETLIATWRSFEYLGTDNSKGMIQEAHKAYPKHRFSVLDMTEIGSLNETFDLVFFIASFHHLDTREKRQKTLSSLKKIIHPHSLIGFTNWNLLSWPDAKKYAPSGHDGKDFLIKIGAHIRYYHGFDQSELEALFRESNYAILENKPSVNERNIISIIWI